ncbi:hypothetical protein [Wohlfahrtiimonas larvae]|uniref:Methyl-accepting transducer domain-containing protein n=1 Tax=Wohlfahrtiimonas larvae TaxID=1157986 RepID=A0ABP9MKC6_9GAMM|nr:hypothetical protein [Wohlfahrtiimonas larvae]
MIEESEAVTITSQPIHNPYEKQRKQIAMAFFVFGILLVGFIIFAFISLPKYQTNQDVEKLSQAYDAIRDIDSYISVQTQGGHLSETLLKDKIQSVTDILNSVASDEVHNVQVIWNGFKQQVSEQSITLDTMNDAIQLKLRVDSASQSLYQTLLSVSQQLSEARSVSLETVRYIDRLANSVVNLHANITRMINSQSQMDIKTISELTDSLSVVQKGLNVLMLGSPADAIQSIKGTLEEENIIESQFIFNQLARDVSNLIKDASGIMMLNQMKTRLQEEKDHIQSLLQATIDHAYVSQQSYIQVTNQSVFLISLVASIGTVLFFIIFSFLFLRLNRSRLSIASEKDARGQRIDEVMAIVERFIILRNRLLPQLSIITSLNDESERILNKGREVRQSATSFNYLVKEMERTYDYLEQALTHDLSLLKQGELNANLDELRTTLKGQLQFFTEQKKELIGMKHCSLLIDEFFSNVVSNTNDSVVAYREVEEELMLIISEIDQLNRDLKE